MEILDIQENRAAMSEIGALNSQDINNTEYQNTFSVEFESEYEIELVRNINSKTFYKLVLPWKDSEFFFECLICLI